MSQYIYIYKYYTVCIYIYMYICVMIWMMCLKIWYNMVQDDRIPVVCWFHRQGAMD